MIEFLKDEDGESIVEIKDISSNKKSKYIRTIKEPRLAPYAKKNKTISIEDQRLFLMGGARAAPGN